ncbi:MAG: ABC transporter permease, partial [Pseudomonadota bacterium]
MNPIALRVLGLILVLVGITLITFALNYFAPGDKATIIAHARYPEVISFPPEILESIREEFHLEEPFVLQYLYWMGGILQGDLGVSYSSGERVWKIFLGNLGETVTLTLTSLTLGLIGAFLLASLAVRNPGTFADRFAIFIASIGAAMPG